MLGPQSAQPASVFQVEASSKAAKKQLERIDQEQNSNMIEPDKTEQVAAVHDWLAGISEMPESTVVAAYVADLITEWDDYRDDAIGAVAEMCLDRLQTIVDKMREEMGND